MGRTYGFDVAIFVDRVSVFVSLAGLKANGFLADRAKRIPGLGMAKDLVQRRHIE